MLNYAERSFGVEIECGTPVIETDNRNGWYKEHSLGINGTQNLLAMNGLPHWANRIGSDGTEIEIRSPILWGTNGLKELRKVMRLLKSNGFYTTDCDGMHCHFDASDLNETQIINIIKSWDNNQDIAKKILGDRFYNDYCGYGYQWEQLGVKPDEDDWYSNYDYKQSIWEYDGEKCYAIEPRQRLRTLEFRQHYGTLNFDEARAWILFVQAFIKAVKLNGEPFGHSTMSEIFKMTRTYKIAQKQLLTRAANPWRE